MSKSDDVAAVAAEAITASNRRVSFLSRHGGNMFAIGFATLFMGVVGGLAIRGLVPAVPVFYAAVSMAAAIAYRLDKSAAERNAWRRPRECCIS